jgi:hypothetical protein
MKRTLPALFAALLAGCGSETSAPGAGAAAADARPEARAARPPEATDRRLAELEQALAWRDQRITDLERSLKARDARLEELAAAVDGLARKQGGETQAIEQDLARVGGRVDELERTLETLRKNSLVPNIARDVPKIEGRVLSVERGPGGAVVLLDVGAKQGVKPEFEFTLARAGTPIAKVVVERVEPEMAAARVLAQKDGESVREGDSASTRP